MIQFMKHINYLTNNPNHSTLNILINQLRVIPEILQNTR